MSVISINNIIDVSFKSQNGCSDYEKGFKFFLYMIGKRFAIVPKELVFQV